MAQGEVLWQHLENDKGISAGITGRKFVDKLTASLAGPQGNLFP
jgi:hypothetical protein